MNDLYVSIKVDREERPDVDAIYMAAVQALTGSGGWPMSVWLTPEREPFFGGTYFPPRDGARGARHGFLTMLRDVHATLCGRSGARRARVGGAGERRARAHRGGRRPPARRRRGRPPASLIADTRRRSSSACSTIATAALRRAPKFPSNMPIRLLLRAHARTRRRRGAADGGADAGEDGGGRHVRPARRAASTATRRTRAGWCPHFEKMLYDNALLAVAYAEACQVTGREDFARVAREMLEYLLREMTAPDGGFYSATDADSRRPDGKSEEGAFFVWSEAEIRQLLGRRPRDRSLHPLLRRDRRRKLRGREHPRRRRARRAPSRPRWRPQRAALYAARACTLAAVSRREDPRRLERPGDLGVRGRRPRVRRAALRRRGRARGDVLLDKMRPGGRLARSAKDGRARRRRLPRRLRVRVRRV